jgi:hypothetical protein
MSTIIVSIGGRTRTFRSLAEVPPALRRRIAQCTSGGNSATLVIADEKGRDEILNSREGGARPASPPPMPLAWKRALKFAVEGAVLAAAAAALWFALGRG